MRSTPILTLGCALANLIAVQATSFVTVTRTVVKDTLVGSVNSASFAPTLDRKFPPKDTNVSRENDPPAKSTNISREDEDPEDKWYPFPNRTEYFKPDNGLPEDVKVSNLAMTLTTNGKELAFTTKLTLEPWSGTGSDFSKFYSIFGTPTDSESQPEPTGVPEPQFAGVPRLEPTEPPTGPPEPLGTGPRGRARLTRYVGNPQAKPKPEAGSSLDAAQTMKVLTLKTEGEVFVFTAKLTLEELPQEEEVVASNVTSTKLTGNGTRKSTKDNKNTVQLNEHTGQVSHKTTKHTTAMATLLPRDDSPNDRFAPPDEPSLNRYAPPTEPSNDENAPPSNDAPHYPKTIKLLPSRKGPTRDIRATETPITRIPKPSAPLTAIPSDWPHPIGPDEDPSDQRNPIKIPEIVNPGWKEPGTSKTVSVQSTAHHYCEVYPYPMESCTNVEWNMEHQLWTPGPLAEGMVKRAEATAAVADDVAAADAAVGDGEVGLAVAATGMVSVAIATVTAMATATVTAIGV